MKTTAYRSLDLIDLPQIKTKKPAKPQNSAKNAGRANKQIGNINISHEILNKIKSKNNYPLGIELPQIIKLMKSKGDI